MLFISQPLCRTSSWFIVTLFCCRSIKPQSLLHQSLPMYKSLSRDHSSYQMKSNCAVTLPTLLLCQPLYSLLSNCIPHCSQITHTDFWKFSIKCHLFLEALPDMPGWLQFPRVKSRGKISFLHWFVVRTQCEKICSSTLQDT